MPISHDRIKRNGWRQGSVFSIEDGRTILANPASDARLILVSHDCDIVSSGLHEPLVEACVAKPIARREGNYVRGKNVRTLHVDLTVDRVPVPHALEASDRQRICRDRLASMLPATDATVPLHELKVITRWLARRYDRAALPDCFNERLRPAQAAMRDALRDGGLHLSGVLIALGTEDELPTEQSYRVYLVGLSPKEVYDDDQSRVLAHAAIARLAAAMNDCRGIIVEEFQLLSEDEFTLHDLRSFVEYSCEDLSLGENEGKPMMPKG